MSIYSVGLRNVGSYQVSGQPYLSGGVTSPVAHVGSRIQFPFVTKRIILTNTGSVNGAIVSFLPYLESEATALGLTSNASGSGNWLYLAQTGSMELDVKCKEIYLCAPDSNQGTGITIYAELTNITGSQMYSLDGIAGVGS